MRARGLGCCEGRKDDQRPPPLRHEQRSARERSANERERAAKGCARGCEGNRRGKRKRGTEDDATSAGY